MVSWYGCSARRRCSRRSRKRSSVVCNRLRWTHSGAAHVRVPRPAARERTAAAARAAAPGARPDRVDRGRSVRHVREPRQARRDRDRAREPTVARTATAATGRAEAAARARRRGPSASAHSRCGAATPQRFDLDGREVDLDSAMIDGDTRERLIDGVRRLDRALCRCTKRTDEEAAEIWRALSAGRYALVEPSSAALDPGSAAEDAGVGGAPSARTPRVAGRRRPFEQANRSRARGPRGHSRDVSARSHAAATRLEPDGALRALRMSGLRR